jgi:ligand-binding sensor domain-containing protein
MRYGIVLLIIFACSMPALGQSYLWRPYTTDNSPLKSNNLSSLYLDNGGILWIGSDSGLTGYNGSAWISYKTPSSDLASDTISSIQIIDETIWIGTSNGLSMGQINAFDNITWQAPYRTDNSELIHNKINSINIDSLGTCWVCTDSGITVITDTSWESISTSSEFYLSKNHVLSINQQPTFMQYVGTVSGGVCRLYNDVDGITGASTIWKQWTTFPDSTGRIQPGLLSDTVQAIMVDKNGDRWYGTAHGVSSHTGEYLKNPYSWRSYITEIGLINNNVQVLAEDASGAIWIGTKGGVSKLIPVDTIWTNFTVDNGLVSNNVRDISVADDGVIWFATDGGLSQLTIIPSAISDNNQILPKSFEVSPVYPNPFNMSTTIEFQLNTAKQIKISIFDISGRLVNTILNSTLMPGSYEINWNGKNAVGNYIASGVYFATISSSNQKSTLKLVLIK